MYKFPHDSVYSPMHFGGGVFSFFLFFFRSFFLFLFLSFFLSFFFFLSSPLFESVLESGGLISKSINIKTLVLSQL